MNNEHKKRWVDALRSGNFSQGTGHLENATYSTYCCLGVLCQLGVESNACIKKTVEKQVITFGEDADWGLAPREIMLWAGLDSNDPTVVFEGEAQTLTQLNDEHHLSFDILANLIEDQL